ncbi:MAG: putative toxin-antitoxin system toxin component, PIN family [Longimicrobiales bacterium]
MRVLLDTNVWIAAFVARGSCHELVEHCKRAHTLVTSAFILSEFEGKLLEKFEVPVGKAGEARTLIETHSDLVTPRPLEEPVSRDPDDDPVLASAVAGRCRCLVTGDRDLLVLREHEGIPILPPKDFWRFEAGEPA